ncbi:MAG: hypothetical protein QG552_175 [Thermodesulfobacteriota bacterium]|nr:hypothetical protein [Thermodesulfobacteriota bacterium]
MADKDAHSNPWLMERRYFSLVIVLVFVILSTVTFFICYRHHTIHTEHILKEDREAANLLSLILDQRLKRIIAVMQSYTHRPLMLQAVRDKDVEKAKVHLISLIDSDPDIDILIITDRQGTLWTAYPERPEVMGKNFAYREWYKDVSKEWKPNISDVMLRIVREKDLAIQISVPFIHEKREVIGILVNTQRTVDLSKLFKQVPVDPGGSTSITDRKGQIVYSSRYDYEKGIRPYPFQSDMNKAMAAKNNTFAVDDPDLGGGIRYISFAQVGNIGWTVLVGRDKRSILLSGSAYYIQVTTIAFLLFLSIVLFLAYSRKQLTTQQIQEQLQAEKKIRAAEERYQSYVDITMQLAWTTNDQGEMVEDNPSWSKYTGRGYEEFKGFGWIEDIHPDDRDPTEKIWRKAIAEKGLYETEYRLRRYDGVYREYLARGIPLFDENGNVREWVGACIDISDRKKAEKEIMELNTELEQRVIERTAQLSAANRELESFSYSVSHDLRAPLRSIDGFSQALLEDYQNKPLDDTGKTYLERVRKATQRMGLLIDDMLKLSRITRAEMKHESVDLSGMIRDIAEAHQKGNPDRAVDLTVQGGITVQGDPYLLKIAMENLVDNAFKFSGKKAHPRIEFGTAVRDGETACFIRDNGVGFDMAYVGKLFGAFQRLHTSDEFPGTGVGLATVQRIIHRHRGQVRAEGEIGKGATFYFTLP